MTVKAGKISSEKRAEEWGIDISLIEANLQRTPEERIEVLQQALDTIFELRKAWRSVQRKGHSSKAS